MIASMRPSPLSLGPMALQWQLLDGPVNGHAFRAYVEQALVPPLRPGDVVVMENLGRHKGQAVRAAIRAAKAHLLFRCSGKTPHRGLF